MSEISDLPRPWIDASEAPDPSTWPPPAEWRTELVQPIEGSG
jgi:hypothetical protein